MSGMLFLAILFILRACEATYEIKVKDIPLDTKFTGVIPPSSANLSSYEALVYYRFFVPVNTTVVDISVQDTGLGGSLSNCETVFFVRTKGLPCPVSEPYYDYSTSFTQFVPCLNDKAKWGTTFSDNFLGDVRFLTNTHWYVGVGRDASKSISAYPCPYSIKVTTSSCQGATCFPVEDLSQEVLPNQAYSHYLNKLSAYEFVVNIPENVGNFTISANNTWQNSTELEIYAISNHSISPGGYWGIDNYDVATFANDSAYLVFNSPPPGPLYVLLEGKYLSYLTTSYTLCTQPNVGPGCAGILHENSDLGPFNRPGGSCDYWEVPTYVANTTFSFNVTVTGRENRQTTVFIQSGIVPTVDNLGRAEREHYAYAMNERLPSFVQLILYPQDFVTNNTWYIGVYTPDGHTFSVTMGTSHFIVPTDPGIDFDSTGILTTTGSGSHLGTANLMMLLLVFVLYY